MDELIINYLVKNTDSILVGSRESEETGWEVNVRVAGPGLTQKQADREAVRVRESLWPLLPS